MKKTIMVCFSFMLLTVSCFAQKTKKTNSVATKASFEVNGVCGMCKTNIEKAAKNAGVSKASWSEETHILAIEFNEKKTNLKKVQEKVAAAGYDNIGATSTESAYDKLHSCCKYDRKKMEEKTLLNQ